MARPAGGLGLAPAPKPRRGGIRQGRPFPRSPAAALFRERSTYLEQAASLKAEAESLVEEMEPGDIQFDDESGEGGTVTVDRERDLAFSAQALAAVEEIDHTLAKMDNGTYGICENCGRLIPKARLEALALCSIVHRLQERGAFQTLTPAGEDRPGIAGEATSSDADRRRRRIWIALTIALVVVVTDQVTKSLAVSGLSSGPVHLIGPFSLELAYNSGVAFQPRQRPHTSYRAHRGHLSSPSLPGSAGRCRIWPLRSASA